MKKLFSTLLMGVFILTSVSVFTSCKDNDDDIKAIREDVAALRAELTNVKAALETELQSSKSQFETQIAQVKKELQDAIDKKADETTVSALREKLTGLETDYLAKVAVLETQIETANKALAKLDDKADKATVDNVIANLAALTGQLSDESKAREALEANLAIQIEALTKLRQELTDANYQGQIDGLIQACQNFDTTVADVNVMKKTINNLELQLTNFNQYVSALEVLVERMLNSISLVPQLFIDGIEAIEFVTLKYEEYGKKNSYYILDKGETEATYRLNPSTTPRANIDEDNIDFLAATAETRAIEVASPVKFNGIKDYRNGLMTVYLKKTNLDTYLGDENSNPIYIVALKVPRNAAAGYEAADVISENSRLVERFYSPRIASSSNPSSTWHANWTGTDMYFDGVNNDGVSLNIERPIHYWSKDEMWGNSAMGLLGKKVDARPLEAVSKIIDYDDDTFEVSSIVTGCLYEYTGAQFIGNCIKRIDVNELKKYGIEINYSIPTEVYNLDAPNLTNQQEFAQILDATTGRIKAKTPAGVTDNKAVIGKEPIVKIQMKDITRNKVIDERYLKIKWSDKRVERKTVEVTFDREAQYLKPCDTNVIKPLTWKEVVNQVYAVLGENGISEETFREVYWRNIDPQNWTVKWDCTNWDSNWQSLTSAPKTKSGLEVIDPTYKPNLDDTYNLHGDAVVATWELNPDQIKTVYCSKLEDTKTFTAVIELPSKDTRYPYDLKLIWKCTFKLEYLPELVGYYDQYWFDKYEKVDILPLQYKSDMQKWWQTYGGKNYCFYDNNLMNPFMFEQMNPTDQGWIVKNVPSCGSWDIQFAHENQIAYYNPKYQTIASAHTNTSNWNTGNGTRIYKSAGKWVDTHEFNDASLVPWRSFDAYKFYRYNTSNTPVEQVLQMMWLDNRGDDFYPLTLTGHDVDYAHNAWSKNRSLKDRKAYLRGEHYITLGNRDDWATDYYKPLLNELDQDPANDLVRSDGTKEPARNHDKPIYINIWGALNAWNYIPVKTYQAYMIAPLRFNKNQDLAVWHDGQVDGSPNGWRKFFTLTDFRGYLVGQINGTTEQTKWARDLWDYYEIQGVNIDLDNVKFSFKYDASTAKVYVDNTMDPKDGMTRDELYRLTNGNVNISFEEDQTPGSDLIYFWNNGGSRIMENVRVWMPVSVKYCFGTLNSGLYGWVYPHEQ